MIMADIKCENVRMPFGKHSGKQLGDILATDPKYLDWLMTADIRSSVVKQAVKEMNEKYAAEISRAIGEED